MRRRFLLGILFLEIVLVAALLLVLRARRAGLADNVPAGPQEPIPSPGAALTPIRKGAADWPCWRGPDGNGKSPVVGIRKDWSGGLKKLWEVNYLCQGKYAATWSAPAVHGNRLIVPGRDDKSDLVFCLDSESGELLWVGSYEAQADRGRGSGPRATPCIDGERVYTFGRAGDLACWRLQDGWLTWRQNVADAGGAPPEWGHSSSPLLSGDNVVVQGGGSALAVAYDKISGRLAWKSMQGTAGYAAVAPLQTQDIGGLLIFHGTGLACIDSSDGRQWWSVPWETAHGVNAVTPAQDGQIVFITSGYNMGCQAMVVKEDGVEVLWHNRAIASHHSDPIIVDGFLYGYSGQSHQNRGHFKCVELATGTERWRTSDVGWGTTVYVDGHLLCMDIKGNLFLVTPESEAFAKAAEFRDALGEVRHPALTGPVVANGRLYLRHLQRLVCYDLMP